MLLEEEMYAKKKFLFRFAREYRQQQTNAKRRSREEEIEKTFIYIYNKNNNPKNKNSIISHTIRTRGEYHMGGSFIMVW